MLMIICHGYGDKAFQSTFSCSAGGPTIRTFPLRPGTRATVALHPNWTTSSELLQPVKPQRLEGVGERAPIPLCAGSRACRTLRGNWDTRHLCEADVRSILLILDS